jgi:hypothetical protein
MGRSKRPGAAKAILSKRSDAGGITVSDFKLYYRAITIKTARHWRKKKGTWRQME